VDTIAISVTEASRNFADCVNRVRYQDTSFILHKGRTAVACIVPAARNPKNGSKLAEALHKAIEGLQLGEAEAVSWLHDLEQARGTVQPQVRPWRF
jgi:antitoxin (DNA-binding transcriptional repressor) of toxin-antitoxin stability system